MKDLNKKVFIVTGGGSGIGRATSLRLAREGACIAIVDLNLDAANEVKKEIQATGEEAISIAADVTNSEAVRSAITQVKNELEKLHGIVNCAGIALGEGGVVDCDESAWDKTMNVNLKSIFLTGKFGIPAIIESGGGAIVSIASVFGFTANKDECAYAASKGAVINLTRQMALQHADEGVRVNAVCPADCDTPLIEKLLGVQGEDLKAAKSELATPIPMGRLAHPDDIAAAIAFLLSDDATFITGVSLPVDGGFLIQ